MTSFRRAPWWYKAACALHPPYGDQFAMCRSDPDPARKASLREAAGWRESPRGAVFRSRWARSIRVVSMNEINLADGEDAALARIGMSRFLKIVSSHGSRTTIA